MIENSRQLVDGLFRGRTGTRVGFNEGPWPDTLAAWVQQGYPTQQVFKSAGETRWREDGRWVPAESDAEYLEPVPFWEHFGCDMVGAGGWFD